MGSGKAVMKIDFKNAFNTKRRYDMLNIVHSELPIDQALVAKLHELRRLSGRLAHRMTLSSCSRIALQFPN
jgi:hypothetical protein